MKRNLIIGILLATITLASCKKKGCTDELASNYDDKAKKEDDSCDYYDETKANIKSTYADIAYASYQDSYDKAVELKEAIYTFVSS